MVIEVGAIFLEDPSDPSGPWRAVFITKRQNPPGHPFRKWAQVQNLSSNAWVRAYLSGESAFSGLKQGSYFLDLRAGRPARGHATVGDVAASQPSPAVPSPRLANSPHFRGGP